MPDHYVYDTPDPAALNQGDVLDRTPEFAALLRTLFPHHADQPAYKYFMVLTQSCDLVRRGGGPCGAQFINLAAVVPVDEAIRHEAAKSQHVWQKKKSVI